MHLAQGVIAISRQKLTRGIVLHCTLCSNRRANTMLLTFASNVIGITPESQNVK